MPRSNQLNPHTIEIQITIRERKISDHGNITYTGPSAQHTSLITSTFGEYPPQTEIELRARITARKAYENFLIARKW